jgi:hypothetical protein
MNHIFALLIALHLLLPGLASAAAVAKHPLSYSLKEYGVMLGIAMLGGLVRWLLAVRRGDVSAWGLCALIGELCVSAFVGLLTFWTCEAMEVHPLLTVGAVGIGGHLGVRLLVVVERAGRRLAEKRLGISLDTASAPLGDR